MHPVPTMEWREGSLRLLDQRLLPSREEYIDCTTVADLAEAIRTLAVRGAPAIGIAAAYGAVIALQEAGDSPGWNDRCLGLMDVLASTRPTAVNLFNCLDIQRETLKKGLSRLNPFMNSPGTPGECSTKTSTPAEKWAGLVQDSFRRAAPSLLTARRRPGHRRSGNRPGGGLRSP